ncbi:AAA family ATPase [Demequina pelophila]|uniref:AAA family ATPase n=1 Tax=Demequina pelophila TaxID=1638984 RepID=UPI0007866442|nr:SMC family ATPase [Demequina pelophila]
MRILRLEIEGFGPYRDAQTIDFTAFEQEGLFAITGRTGAGKSTILDAICFALYDKVPRYDKAEPVLRSHFCGEDDVTRVALEYELGTTRYRIERSPSYWRAKKRGTGLTEEKASAKLYVDRGGWEILAAMPREVAEHVAHTVPLTGDQFLQVILLAQGRFAEFLKADTSERRTVLRSLFGTQRFEDLEQRIRDVAKARQAQVEAADAQLAELVRRAATLVAVDVPPAAERAAFWEAARVSVDDARETSAHARTLATASAEAAAAALHEARETERIRDRLAKATVTVTELGHDAPTQAEREARVALARRAVPVAGPLREADRAARAASDASTSLAEERDRARDDASAGLAWPSGDIAGAGESELRARASELATELGETTAALTAERSIPALEATHARAVESVEAAREAQSATREQIDALPKEEQRLREAREAAAGVAARAEDLAAAVTRATDAVEAHALVATLEAQLAAASATEATRAQEHAAASATHADLVTRRLRSQAAHLAEELVDGEPCPVCGGVDHPSPAQPSDDHVTDEQVDEAFETVRAADAALGTAREARADVDRRLGAAREKAGEGDAESAAAALEAARDTHRAAVEATAERVRLDKELDRLAAREQTLKAKADTHTAELENAQASVTEAATALAAARDAAAQRPDAYASVAAYVAALESAKSLLARLIDANERAEDAAAADAKARTALDEALSAAGFPTAEAGGAEEARAAALDPAELARLEQAADRYRTELASARGVVAELSDRDLPEEVADLPALELASIEAADARDRAIEEATAAWSRAAALGELRAEHDELGATTARARAERDAVLTLADSLEGKAPNERRLRLESFVLASKLERIVAAANGRLQTMSSGQYRLEHDDSSQYRNKETGLALRIADAHTGQSRSTRSLSGGETFLASLSLALGLAETVTSEAGGIELSTLFIDEGFGSLDGDTLEVAMSTLDDLRASGRTVGLISHVEAMHDAIPARLEVTKAADGSSRVVAKAGAVD